MKPIGARFDLIRLAFDAIECSREGQDFNGGDIQDKAVEYGILTPVQRTAPCGERCACAEVTDFPTTCYVLSEDAAALQRGLREVKP